MECASRERGARLVGVVHQARQPRWVARQEPDRARGAPDVSAKPAKQTKEAARGQSLQRYGDKRTIENWRKRREHWHRQQIHARKAGTRGIYRTGLARHRFSCMPDHLTVEPMLQ